MIFHYQNMVSYTLMLAVLQRYIDIGIDILKKNAKNDIYIDIDTDFFLNQYVAIDINFF